MVRTRGAKTWTNRYDRFASHQVATKPAGAADRGRDRHHRRIRARPAPTPSAGSGRTQQQQQPAPGQSVLRLLPPDAVTQHSIETAWGKLDYTATAGTLSLFDQSGERSAAIFYTAYVAKDADSASRPLTFVFNGGPGAASAYPASSALVGPRIVDFEPNGDGSAARLQDNPDTWLRLHRPGDDRSGRLGLEPAGQARRRQRVLGRAAATPRRSPRPLRSIWRRTTAPPRPNIFWAKAMAAFAPPRWRARCNASRASSSPAS